MKELLQQIKNERLAAYDRFERAWRDISTRVHGTAVEKGWWDTDRNEGELIALAHSELSEALEALRKGNPASKKISECTHVEEELADLVIRVMDMAQARGWRVGSAIVAKMEYNKKRPVKHGKLF